jgi:uroporphyrinogen decarboxylase
MTPILKIKEVLGDKMCITGNLSPALLSVGTPDQVYASTKQICSEMGKTGFIMTSGCSVPIDAKRENVAAAIAAALDS